MQREEQTIKAMIGMYCRDHHAGDSLCDDCSTIQAYALKRLELCPFQEGKTTCAKCPVHCYKPEMRARVREVMKTSGPHMLYRHPVLSFQHLVIDSMRKVPIKKQREKKPKTG